MLTSITDRHELQSPDVDCSAAYLCNRAATSQALLTFLSQLETLSRQALEIQSPEMIGHLVDFMKSSEQNRIEIGKTLKRPLRPTFDRLARRYQEDELGRLSDMATLRNRQYWDRTNERLEAAQVRLVIRWPLCERTFKQSAENGLTIIADHSYSAGWSLDATAARQARFMSGLTACRILALLGGHFARAVKIHKEYGALLLPEQARTVAKQMTQAERLIKADILAESIVGNNDQQAWTKRARQAAGLEYPRDKQFREQVEQAIADRHAIRDAEKALSLRYNRCRVTLASLGACGRPRPKTLTDLFGVNAEVITSWNALPAVSQASVRRILAMNAKGEDPADTLASRRLWSYLSGVRVVAPRHYLDIDYDHPRFDILPFALREELMKTLYRPDKPEDLERKKENERGAHRLAASVAKRIVNESLHLYARETGILTDYSEIAFDPSAVLDPASDMWDADTINIAARGDLQNMITRHLDLNDGKWPDSDTIRNWAGQLDLRWGALIGYAVRTETNADEPDAITAGDAVQAIYSEPSHPMEAANLRQELLARR